MVTGHKGVIYVMLAILLLSGCSVASQDKPDIKAIEDVKIDAILAYSGTYVGDNSNISALLRELAGGETVNHLDLTGEKISVTYGVDESISQESFDSHWFNGQNSEHKNFYFNAIYLTILVPNAKEYSFRIEGSDVSVTRERMVEVLSKKFNKFPEEDEIWDEKVVEEFVKSHQDEIEEMGKNDEKYFVE
ncbi:DUF4825 domain-containing protein [Bacillus sp. NTK071]|uniref:DUF4825 domain-containing protein n=1 Tax=Bacillus sp. NTK071 TaxID=2802175 RepID=UPI001A9033C5|nr:DUF4825 domain-containing protein [Bacillus sp. NTK071]MBN8211139.1 DUF4825 domain-containing protein [Bacillus sp. NTK071]